MKKYFSILRNCILFNNIADENLLPMLGCLNAKVLNFNKGETVINEGEPAKNVCILLSGKIQIFRVDFYGNRNIIAKVEPSHLFGESYAFADVKSMPLCAVASENTEVMIIDCRRLTRTCSNSCEFHNQIILNLLKIIAMKNISFNQKAEVTSKRTTREKLLTYLMQQAKKHNSDSFTIPFDRQELADYLEVDRSGLSAEISKLRAEGFLESNRSNFNLLPPMRNLPE